MLCIVHSYLCPKRIFSNYEKLGGVEKPVEIEYFLVDIQLSLFGLAADVNHTSSL